jgi:predicted TIM-barrel enzyme
MGLTTGGSIGAEATHTLDECVVRIQRITEAAVAASPNVLLLIHGGPIALPEHAQYVLERCRRCHGFYGASSMERLPVELGIRAQVESFKRIRCKR